MRVRRYGRIVNVSSVAAIGTALPGNAFYAATEAEVVILTRRFAMELGPHGITVNAVAPGFVRTDLTQGGRGAADWQGTEERLAARAMMGRIGEPEDIANAVVFLVSPKLGWITAQMLTVDGGRMDYIGDGWQSIPEQVTIGAAPPWLIIGLTFWRCADLIGDIASVTRHGIIRFNVC